MQLCHQMITSVLSHSSPLEIGSFYGVSMSVNKYLFFFILGSHDLPQLHLQPSESETRLGYMRDPMLNTHTHTNIHRKRQRHTETDRQSELKTTQRNSQKSTVMLSPNAR